MAIYEDRCNVPHGPVRQAVYQFPSVGPFNKSADKYPCDTEATINGKTYLAFFIPGFGFCYVPKDKLTEIETYEIGEVYLDRKGRAWQLLGREPGRARWQCAESAQWLVTFKSLNDTFGPMTKMVKAQPDGNMF
jgi:hypothetical protein